MNDFPAQGFPGVVPDVITFNVGISAYMTQHREDRAFEVLDEMSRRGVHPRADTFNSILTGLSKVSDLSLLLPQRANYFIVLSARGCLPSLILHPPFP